MSRRIANTILIAALALVSVVEGEAKGKGFNDVVKHLQTAYHAKKTRIPMLGVANFALKIIRPAGVKGFKLAVFEEQDFLANSEMAASFGSVMREAYGRDWMPLVQLHSTRDGHSRVFIFAKYAGKDVEFAVTTLAEREAIVFQAKFNPDAAARFLENPKIMGISLGNGVRNNGAGTTTAQTVPRRPSASGASRTASGDRTIAELEGAPSAGSEARPALKSAEPAGEEARADAKPGSDPVAPSAPAGHDTIRIETRLVNLNVKAMDRAGKPLTDLTPKDFEVYEEGVRQNVEHFRPVDAPVNVVLLMDLSGSTRKKRQGMADAAKRFIDSMPARDKLSVVAFTRRYKALTGFTDDKAALKAAVDKINNIEGGTAFYDSMWKALDDLKRIPDARKAIVVLTDGEDEALLGNEDTTHSFEDLLGRAAEEDVTIFPIYFKASDVGRKVGVLFGTGSLLDGDKVRTARRQLEALAEQTGGDIVNAQQEADLQGAYDRVATELHTFYSLGYLPDAMKHDGGFRKINVKITRPGADGALARTRKGYFDK